MTSSMSSIVPTSTLSTSTTGPPAATSSPAGNGGGGGGPTSSPLLFFVALGFGVVFTNLWIIVGVKYCFRYNQRNRRAQQDENGEPIDMTAMPRTHRRRREKKLMTMDEVNERFPLMKYKAWMTTREEEGLPTAGGVVAPSESRAASMRNVEGVIPPVPTGRKSEEVPRPATSNATRASEEVKTSLESAKAPEIEMTPLRPPPDASMPGTDESKEGTLTTENATSQEEHAEDDLDDDDQIQMAVPTQMMANPGDSCAICLDTLDDDDDIRGLACGHAFHASCLDPWLTSRRACCPLCKADYYVPKPRPEGEAAAEATRVANGQPAGAGMNVPHPPQYAFMGHRGPRPRMLLPGRFMTLGYNENPNNRYGFPHRAARPSRNSRSTPPSNLASNTASNGGIQQPNTWRSRMRSFAPSMSGRFARGNNNNDASVGAPEISGLPNATPGQLEAGQR